MLRRSSAPSPGRPPSSPQVMLRGSSSGHSSGGQSSPQITRSPGGVSSSPMFNRAGGFHTPPRQQQLSGGSNNSSGSSSSRGSEQGPPPKVGVRRGSHQLPQSCTFIPRRLLEQHSLPVAAYLHTPTPPPPGLDPKTPLLLYKTSQNTKVRAVSLKTNASGAIIATGPMLVIPETYTGWFSVVSGRCKGATCFTSIEDVADQNLTFFLTRHEIPSYVRMSDNSSSGNPRYRRSVVQAGYVLKLLGLFEDAKRGNHGRAQQQSNSSSSGDRFAQCLDHRGQVVFVPLSATGKFYATADRILANRSLEQVFLMSQLIEGFQLPLTVRLVCGYMARVPNSFTGLLKLESWQQEHVVLACTMTTDTNATFLEMDLDSNFLLSPIKDPVFSRTPLYLKTKSFCEDEAESWQRQIKITHHVTERRAIQSNNSPNATFSDTASSTGLSSPHDPPESSRRARHGRGIREIKARDRSRESRKCGLDNFRESKADRSRDKSKADKSRDKSRDGRMRDKSKDSKLRIRIREKSRDRLTIRNGDATSFDILREKSNKQEPANIKQDKLEGKIDGKLPETRKLSKQNTYIFQNGRNIKYLEKRKDQEQQPPPIPEHSLNYRLRHSLDTQEYSTVLDDISPLRQTRTPEEEDDCQYAEICDNIYSTTVLSSSSDQDSMGSSYNHRMSRNSHRRDHRFTSSSHNWSFGTGTSSSDDNHYSFTLLRQDVGHSYMNMKLAGFSAGDIIPKRQFIASSRHAYRARSPASSQC